MALGVLLATLLQTQPGSPMAGFLPLTPLSLAVGFLPSPHLLTKYQEVAGLGFPGGAVVESLPANAGDTGSSPGLGRSHMPQSN